MSFIIEFDDNQINFLTANRPYIAPMFLVQIPGQNKTFWDVLLEGYDKAIQQESYRNSLPSMFVNKNQFLANYTESKPLLFDRYFQKGETIVLASSAGVGKTFLSIEIAKSPEIKKALFLTLEDYSSMQLSRYIENLEFSRFEVINYRSWCTMYDQLRYSISQNVTFQVFSENNKTTSPVALTERRRLLLSRWGIKEELIANNILLFEVMMESVKQMGFDFICVDSLNALFGNPNRIDRRSVERLIQATSKYGITLLLVHHLNKEGEIGGSQSLIDIVDSAYVLTREPQGSGTKDFRLRLTERKKRFSETPLEAVIFSRSKNEDHTISHNFVEIIQLDQEIVNQYQESPLQNAILDYLEQSETPTITKDNLKIYLNEENISYSSLSNALKKLEEKGKIVKADGKTWVEIACGPKFKSSSPPGENPYSGDFEPKHGTSGGDDDSKSE